MNSIIDRGIARKHIWYFDPDITVRCGWEFFERWVRHGVCICQETTMGTMPSNHPLRCEWMELAREAGWGEPFRQQERYYNSGFVGMSIEHRTYLDTWIAAAGLATSTGVEQDLFMKGTRAETFYTVDQDTMNISTMYAQVPLSAIGPEGMGFIQGGFTMYHTVGSKKPWRKNFLRSALKGSPPSGGDKYFLQCADGPLHPYTSGQLKQMRRSARWAGLIGRFFRRT